MSPQKLAYAHVVKPKVCIGVGHTHANMIMVAAYRNKYFTLKSGQVCKSASVSCDRLIMIISHSRPIRPNLVNGCYFCPCVCLGNERSRDNVGVILGHSPLPPSLPPVEMSCVHLENPIGERHFDPEGYDDSLSRQNWFFNQ